MTNIPTVRQTEGEEKRVPQRDGWTNSSTKMLPDELASQLLRAEMVLDGRIHIGVGWCKGKQQVTREKMSRH